MAVLLLGYSRFIARISGITLVAFAHFIYLLLRARWLLRPGLRLYSVFFPPFRYLFRRRHRRINNGITHFHYTRIAQLLFQRFYA